MSGLEEVVMEDDETVLTTNNKTRTIYDKNSSLAQRTSEILRNYRAFLSEYETEIAANTKKSLEPPEDGFRHLHYYYYDHKINNNSISSHGGGDTAVCILRDFSMPEVPLGSSDNVEEERRYNKMPPIVSSKRFKYGVLMSLGFVALIVGLVSASVKNANNKRMPERENTQGWHSEAAYLLEHENEHKDENRLPHYNLIAARNKQLPDLPIETADLKDLSVEVDTELDDVEPTDGLVSFDLAEVVHDSFKPMWMGRSDGWLGGSHEEAMQFCNINGKALCPFSAICPHGSGNPALFGKKPVDFNDSEQYAPAYGHDNRWVNLTTCLSYEQVYHKLPPWGLNGDMSDLKRHILCCNMAAYEPSI